MKDIKLNSRGFTIIELMIALSVLSIILVMSSVILINIGAIYSKGVNIASLQNANRNIVADISQAIQFGGTAPKACGPPAPLNLSYCSTADDAGVHSFCVDTTRYSFVMNRELGDDSGDPNSVPPKAAVSTQHVLWRDTMKSADDPCTPLKILTLSDNDLSNDASSVAGTGYEMAPNHTRLTRFYTQVNPATGIYSVSVWMAHGDSDLVIDNFGKNSTDGLNTPLTPSCKSGSGSQYCAVSNIDTQVTRRKTN